MRSKSNRIIEKKDRTRRMDYAKQSEETELNGDFL